MMMEKRRCVRGLLVAVFLFMTGTLFAHETFVIDKWNAQALFQGEEADSQSWKSVPANRPYYFPEEKSAAQNGKKIVGLWCEYSFQADENWKGKRVVLEIPDNAGARVTVFINGVETGKVYLPVSFVLLSDTLKYAEANTLRLRFDQAPAGEGSSYLKRTGKYPNSGNRAPILHIGGGCFISDVFANPSYRKHSLSLEAEILFGKGCQGTLTAEILDAFGKTVRQGALELNVSGEKETAILEIPWNDPIYWELGKPYLYQCRLTFRSKDGTVLDQYPLFFFGFREIWKEGRQIYMNGHIQRLRTTYSYQANPQGAVFLRMIGYNTIAYQHKIERWPEISHVDEYSRLGIGMIVPTPTIPFSFKNRKRDSKLVQDYQEVLKRFMRQYRNSPSIMAFYLAVNCWCPPKNQDPQYLGQYIDRSSNVAQVNFSRELARKSWSNVLYYAHAAGNAGDISSDNLYLNFTPLQEREEWLSQWSEKGIIPWHAAEFGQPYNASFWLNDAFIYTEMLASYYGDRIYSEESGKVLRKTFELSVKNRTNGGKGHGVTLSDFSFEDDSPLYWDFLRMFTWRTNRAFRTFGMNGGLTYFNLNKGYGDFRTSKDKKWFHYYRYNQVPEFYQTKPEWANRAFDIFQMGNHDFLAYIGGFPAHTDKIHAYYAGETIRKQLVFIWDGAGKETFSARWSVKNPAGKTVASGTARKTMSTGDIFFSPVTFCIPAAEKKTHYTIEAVFTGMKTPQFTDQFALEVYPKKRLPQIVPQGDVEVFDPDGKACALLDAFQIPYKKRTSIDFSPDAKYLIIGKNALEKENFMFDGEKIRKGRRVLILPQSPEVWQKLGFQPLDSMSRQVFLRDRGNPAFSGLTDDVLANWRGAPDYGSKFGSIMKHMTPPRSPLDPQHDRCRNNASDPGTDWIPPVD